MSYETSWNKLVSQYNKNRSSKEEIVQSSWEQLLSFTFDYSDTDIHPQFPVKMGVSTKLADILVRHGDDDLFVMELKRHTLHEGQEQLFSYLNQLKIDIGVLVCDKLYVYDFDYTKKAENYSSVEIDFTQDNPDGIKFVELFTSDNFDRQKIKDFIAQKNQSKENIELIRKDLTDDFVLSVVKNHLTEKYPAEDVESVLSDMVITVRPKGAVTPAPVVASDFVPKAKGEKDDTQYSFKGNIYGKGRLVLAVISDYVRLYPETTREKLKKTIFPKKLQGSLEVVEDKETVLADYQSKLAQWEQTGKKKDKPRFRFFKEELQLSNGEMYVTTEWGSGNIDRFIDAAKKLGYEITEVPQF